MGFIDGAFKKITGIIDTSVTRANENQKLTVLDARSGNDKINIHTNFDGSVDVDVNGRNFSFTAEEAQNLEIRGGRGNDRITQSGWSNNEEPNITIKGGSGNDTIHGTAGDDNIDGGSGNDTIYGHSGNDNIDGGSGNDRIHGGAGNDMINGGMGNDNIFGNAGDDQITGGGGFDFADGGKGSDRIQDAVDISLLLGRIKMNSQLVDAIKNAAISATTK